MISALFKLCFKHQNTRNASRVMQLKHIFLGRGGGGGLESRGNELCKS